MPCSPRPGAVLTYRPAVFLRDHCHCAECVHEDTKQRLIETFDIPEDIAFKPEGVREEAEGFRVTWNDGHESFYSKEWLRNVGLKRTSRAVERQGLVEPVFWTGSSIKSSPPSISYDEIATSPTGVRDWLYLIRTYGFAYIPNTPATPEATEALLNLIGPIRNTHYGGFYDFTADLAKGDTAYTQLGIGAHTDNTYFTDPAGLQLFHLLSHTDGSGGASQLVDGFGAAAELYEVDREAYEILSTVRVHSHASGNEDSSIQPVTPMPVLVHDEIHGHLVQVRWNTTDRARVDAPVEEVGKWYAAARTWTEILRRREYWEQLKPGTPLIFDNWRVLHGRSEFTGKRRMCGGYINRDDFISRYKMAAWGRGEALRQVAQG
ncbi:Trimethyllysine dioxygenase [Trichodelitschia bisporula]|uniref:Trimethyllysine dioxygenase n=1 Tax=Trichodelitschia bisporula TaxID=703511 RepID=A0A6G1I9S8_9PEZI|nr:Trimethyllysine dioxygenase [Trichodelitschia bisporula]